MYTYKLRFFIRRIIIYSYIPWFNYEIVDKRQLVYVVIKTHVYNTAVVDNIKCCFKLNCRTVDNIISNLAI